MSSEVSASKRATSKAGEPCGHSTSARVLVWEGENTSSDPSSDWSRYLYSPDLSSLSSSSFVTRFLEIVFFWFP